MTEARTDRCIKCGLEGPYLRSPPICQSCRYRNELRTDKPFLDFRVALRDANTQKVMTQLLADMQELMSEYDMHDTIFGEKVAELLLAFRVDSY